MTSTLPTTMQALVTLSHGGYEQLVMQNVPRPVASAGEVVLQVLAAGINNTDINTRLGWYAPQVTGSTQAALTDNEGLRASSQALAGWRGQTPFPLIQGADCCGRVVEVGEGVAEALLGQRALVRPCQRLAGFGNLATRWLGTDFAGAFAQFVKCAASEVFPVRSTWSDAELASLPCAYGTAENMLQRAKVHAGDVVLVTGASGGVGSAAVQLARSRGATVWAIAAEEKAAALQALGAQRVIARGADLGMALGEGVVSVVIDPVAGPEVGALLQVLQPGGRYAVCGAIAGPMVDLDMRKLYLKDLTLIGCTAWDEPVFTQLIALVEQNAIRPLLAQTFALKDMALAQEAFLAKRHVGKLVVLPPPIP
jgi:NADPH:quinone reductase-like Zn-dependent oxidoreductase